MRLSILILRKIVKPKNFGLDKFSILIKIGAKKGSVSPGWMFVFFPCGVRELRLFPSISTGAYGFPVELASRIALSEVRRFLEGDAILKRVLFVCFGEGDYRTYLEAARED